MKRVVLMAILLSVTALARAATRVEIEASTVDTVGARLVYAIKERIRASLSLEQTLVQSKARMKITIVTSAWNRDSPNVATMYSVVIFVAIPERTDYALQQYVGSCGSDVLHQCADSLVAHIDEEADKIKKLAIPTLKL
jgi:hypothetical protein